MKRAILRSVFALGAVLSIASLAAAQQRTISEIFDQWSDDGVIQTEDLGVQSAAYEDEGEMPSPPEAETTHITQGSRAAHKSHSDCKRGNGGGSCSCGPCNGCCSCDDGCACGTACGTACGGCSDACCSCDSFGGGCGDACCSDGCAGCCCDDSCCSFDCGSGGCSAGCGANCVGDCDSNYGMNTGMVYAEIQNLFLRTHVNSEVVGKLREKYEWSPRVVVGYETPNGLGVRSRWWSYSRTTSAVDGSNSLALDLNVFDAEGTARFSSKRADLVVAGGFRYADFSIAENDDDDIRADLPGITFALDGRMAVCCKGNTQWSGVCGARWSLLGGDWEGQDNNMVESVYDDNVVTQELYGGVEYLCHHCNCDLYARVVFEVQNWHSDAIGENSATDSIGFIGPAIHGGVSF